MTVFVGLLRAVNLGGATQVAMADLRDRVTALGFERVQSLLQSGNLVFEARTKDPRAVEATLNRELAPMLGARTEFFVRSADEWRAIVAGNPFPTEAGTIPAYLVVAVLRDAPSADAYGRLEAEIPGREQVRGGGRHAYLVYPEGQGRSKVTAAFLERHLGTRVTARNWNTVRKLDRLAAA